MVYITLLQWKIVEEETNNKTTTRRFLDEEARSPKSLTTPSMRTPSTRCCSRGKVLWKAKNVAVPLKRAPTPTENGKNHESIALRQNYLQNSHRTTYNKAIHGKTRTQKSRFQRKTDPELNFVSLQMVCLIQKSHSVWHLLNSILLKYLRHLLSLCFQHNEVCRFCLTFWVSKETFWCFGQHFSKLRRSSALRISTHGHMGCFFPTPRPRWKNLRWDLRPNFESCCVNRNIAL